MSDHTPQDREQVARDAVDTEIVLPLVLDSEIIPSCHHCGKLGTRNSDTGPLKRCAGCGVVLYCDKVCQKAAWPEHK